MDGVLTDFIRGYKELTGIDISGSFHDNPKFWEPIDDAGVEFWEKLKWTKDGKKLWNHIKKYNPEILSTPSKTDESRVGKKKWVEKELPGVHLILRMAEYKKEFASPEAILIDDRKENIDNWKDAGGIGILHKSAEDTIKQLKNYSL
jgi:hypothetical protein